MFSFFLLILAGFLVIGRNVLAESPEEIFKNSDNIALTETENEKIWLSVTQLLTNQWMDVMASSNMTLEQEAVLSIVRTGNRAQLVNYFFSKAPADASLELGKAIIKLARFILSGADPAQIVGEFERLSVEKAKEYLVNWLNQNSIKISNGNLPVQYMGSDNIAYKYNLPYIVTYKEDNNGMADAAIGVYSSKTTKTLIPQIMNGWTGGISDIPPYIFRLTGKVKKENGAYRWQGKPNFEYIFNEEVPQFDFKEPTPFENFKKEVVDYIKSLIPFSIFNNASVVSSFENFEEQNLSNNTESIEISEETKKQFLNLGQQFEKKVKDFLSNIKLKPENGSTKENKEPDQNILAGMQEQLDDIAEQIDVLLAKYTKIIVENNLEEIPEDDVQENTKKLKNSLGSNNKVKLSYQKLLITEIQTKGANEKDEFVEIYNPNNTDIVLTDWYLQRKTKDANSFSTFASSNLFENRSISAKGYFLIARTGSTFANKADALIDKSLTDDNTLALKDPNGDIVDKVGWGLANDYETEATVNPESGKSISRKLLDNENYQDTDNNKADFELIAPTPKQENIASNNNNDSHPKILISGLQIGENEYVELYNPNNELVDVSDYYFSYFSSSREWNDPYRSKKFPEDTVIEPNSYYLIALADNKNIDADWQPYESELLSNTNGSIAIFPWNPALKTIDEARLGRADAVGWGNVIVKEEEAISSFEIDKGLAREEEATFVDSDNNKLDFIITDSKPNNSYKAEFSNLAWPNFQKDQHHSGLGNLGNKGGISIGLEKSFGVSNGASEKIIIGPEDNIYVLTSEKENGYLGKIYALTSSGEVLWQFSEFEENPSYISAGEDGNVYVASGKTIYAFDFKIGKIQWIYKNDEINSITGIALDNKTGRIYFTDYSKLYCLTYKGKEKWVTFEDTPPGGSANGGPAIGNDGMVYVAWLGFLNLSDQRHGALFAYNPDGTIKYKQPLDFGMSSVAFVAENGTVYVTAGVRIGDSGQNTIFGIKSDGSLLWEFNSINSTAYEPISVNGYLVSGDNRKRQVDAYNLKSFSQITYFNMANGSVLWQEELEEDSSIDSQPIAGINGSIVVVKTIYKSSIPVKRELRIYDGAGNYSKSDLDLSYNVLPNFAIANNTIYILSKDKDQNLKLSGFVRDLGKEEEIVLQKLKEDEELLKIEEKSIEENLNLQAFEDSNNIQIFKDLNIESEINAEEEDLNNIQIFKDSNIQEEETIIETEDSLNNQEENQNIKDTNVKEEEATTKTEENLNMEENINIQEEKLNTEIEENLDTQEDNLNIEEEIKEEVEIKEAPIVEEKNIATDNLPTVPESINQ